MKERFLENADAEALRQLNDRLPSAIADHYANANAMGCTDIIWSNEGLYLLNSLEEYQKLNNLFEPHSKELTCICCFRELESFKVSYRKQHEKSGIEPSSDPDSYRYLNNDSWLFDYSRKREILSHAFDNIIYFQYSRDKMVERFMQYIGHPIDTPEQEIPRLNITPPDTHYPR